MQTMFVIFSEVNQTENKSQSSL